MTRTLYRWLVCLHPPAFRLRFEEELLWIFDESRAASSAIPLLCDVVISLVRQWLVRSGLWKWALGAIAGVVPIYLGFGSFFSRHP